MKFDIVNAGDLKEGDLFVNLEKTPGELVELLEKGAAIGIYIRGKGKIPDEALTEKVYLVRLPKARGAKATKKA